MSEKVYCFECRHCLWHETRSPSMIRNGDLSRCGKRSKPDKRIDDPVTGPRVERGEPLWCSVANRGHDCESWEQADEATISRRKNPPSEEPDVTIAVFAGLIGVIILIAIIAILIGRN